MAAPSTLSVALLLGFSFPLASAIAATSTHYGIHGMPEPVFVGKSQSHGCIRLTNWDALTLAASVDASVPVVMQE